MKTQVSPALLMSRMLKQVITGQVTVQQQFALGSPVTSDNCSVASVKAYVGVTEITPATHLFGIGTTTVKWKVTDASVILRHVINQ
jgi:hypothetical protein